MVFRGCMYVCFVLIWGRVDVVGVGVGDFEFG